ncbi:hypothetical protein FACS189494_07990 [Spirochaetia bacterium]|nr:hypothetical protein FACS189494_07990 [Spirochaetia bacterium]
MMFSIYRSIIRGHKLFRVFVERNKIPACDFTVIFPQIDNEINLKGLSYLNSFYMYIEHLRNITLLEQIVSAPVSCKFHIISEDEMVFNSARMFSNKIKTVELWKDKDINDLTMYYTTYRPPNIIFLSIDYPNGRNCSNLIGIKNIDLKKLICMGVYGISYNFFCKMREPEMPKIPVFGINDSDKEDQITEDQKIENTGAKVIKSYFNLKKLEQLKTAYRGYRTYNSVKNKYNNPAIFIYDYSGIGDVYVFCMLLKANYSTINNGNFVITVNHKALVKIFKLFDLENFILITEKQAYELTVFSFLVPQSLRIRNITPFPRFNFTDISFRFGGVILNMLEMYKYQMFKLPENAEIQHPKLKPDNETIKKIFSENKLITGKTVVLSPSSRTTIGFSDTFWRQLGRALQGRGFIVCTNVVGTEQPILGTIPISFSFQDSEGVLKKAGLFIGIRSGFCDVICNAECKKIILYPTYRLFNSSLYDFCSFERMGIGQNIIELQGEIENEDKLLQKILENINGKR